jgi:uncharacterized membrane protein YqiK
MKKTTMKETILNALSSYWWVILPLLAIIFYKKVLRIFGIIIIPEDKIGLVTKKFVLFGADKNLPDGKIIATNGESGFQATTLAPGLYFWKWPWQYEITLENFVVIPQGKIGLVLAKDGASIPTGSILGRYTDCDTFQNAELFLKNGGMKGRQTTYITAGSYRINSFLFEITIVPMTSIEENQVGIITTLDGQPLGEGQIAGKSIEGHNNFQDFDKFLTTGGNKGLQPQVILAGSYNINPWAVTVEQTPMTEIPIGYVGVVISYIGEEGQDLTGQDFKHGNLVAKGQKGVWVDTFGPGKYPINKFTLKVELVPTTNLVLNWANARTESHNLDKHLSTITVRSKDGFQFNLDVSQIIHIPMTEAPKVIARFGNMNNLVSQVLEPTIGNYFRNSAQNSEVLGFLTSRSDRQKEAKQHIDEVLKEYNVQGVDTLIGDIVPPESIMKTLSDRKIAEEQQITFKAQQISQESRQKFEKEKAIADIQPDMVKANQGVEIAEKVADAQIKKATGEAQSVKLRAAAEAEQIRLTGEAEATKILAIGKSTAESYELQVKAMGKENFAGFKITEMIGTNKIKVMPDILIGGGEGGGGGAMEGLLGLKLMESMDFNKKSQIPDNKNNSSDKSID